jgi:hypothetical protein
MHRNARRAVERRTLLPLELMMVAVMACSIARDPYAIAILSFYPTKRDSIRRLTCCKSSRMASPRRKNITGNCVVGFHIER